MNFDLYNHDEHLCYHWLQAEESLFLFFMRDFSFIRMAEYKNFPWKITNQYFLKKTESDLSGNSQPVLTDFLWSLKDYCKLRWADAHYRR